MFKNSILILHVLFLFGQVSALEIGFPVQKQSPLSLEVEVLDQMEDGIPYQVILFSDAKASESFIVSRIPGYLRLDPVQEHSLSLNAGSAGIVFFDWLTYPKGQVIPGPLDVPSIAAYSRRLEAHFKTNKKWEFELLNESDDFAYDYGKVIVNPPSGIPYEISKKPRIKPLGSEAYFIVDYKLRESPPNKNEVDSGSLATYNFRDYLLHYKEYLVIFRVQIKKESLDPSISDELDRFIRSIVPFD